MKFQIDLPSQKKVYIEAEPIASLIVSLANPSSLQEVQNYALEHGVVWLAAAHGMHCLFLPQGTLQQRISEGYAEREEVSLIHFPCGGALAYRRVLPESIALEHPWAEALRVSTISLLRPLA